MTITVVAGQEGGTNANGTTSVSRAFGSNVTSGNLILVAAMKSTTASDAWLATDCTLSAGTATVGTIALDKTIEIQVAGGFFQAVALWSCLVTSSGSCTMQAAGAAAGTDLLIASGEYAATSGWDGSRLEASASASTATDNTNAATGNATSAKRALFWAAVAIDLSATITITPDAAFTQVFEDENGLTDEGGSAIRQLVATGTTDSGDWTIGNNGGWGCVMGVYKEVNPDATGGSAPMMGQVLT